MTEEERKALEIKNMLKSNSGSQLAAKVNRKTGANVSDTTITRASNKQNISSNMLHLLHYVLTH